MNSKEDICLKDLCGVHKFQGIELSTRKITDIFGVENECDVVKFMLDNITYEAIEAIVMMAIEAIVMKLKSLMKNQNTLFLIMKYYVK